MDRNPTQTQKHAPMTRGEPDGAEPDGAYVLRPRGSSSCSSTDRSTLITVIHGMTGRRMAITTLLYMPAGKTDRWRRFRGGRSGDGGGDPEGRGVEGGWGRIRIRKGGYTVTHHDYLPIRIASKDVRSLSRNTQQPSGAASVHPAQAQWT